MKTKKGTFTLEMSTFIKASAETIYAILSSKEGLEEFMECEVESELKVGAAIKFTWPFDCNGGEGTSISGGEIQSMIPNTLISFTWGDASIERNFPWGSSLVEFKITPENDGCRVAIHHYDLPSEFEINDHEGGWKHFLGAAAAKWETK